MKKIPLLLGTLGGAVAGYLFSNKRLRTELGMAKDAEQAAKVFAKYLSKHGKEVGEEAVKFVKSKPVQEKFTQAKKMAAKEMKKAQAGAKDLFEQGTKMVAGKAKKVAKKAGSKIKKTAKKVTTKRKKTGGKAKAKKK